MPTLSVLRSLADFPFEPVQTLCQFGVGLHRPHLIDVPLKQRLRFWLIVPWHGHPPSGEAHTPAYRLRRSSQIRAHTPDTASSTACVSRILRPRLALAATSIEMTPTVSPPSDRMGTARISAYFSAIPMNSLSVKP